MAVAAVVHW
jgi:hypothetical protein